METNNKNVTILKFISFNIELYTNFRPIIANTISKYLTIAIETTFGD